MTRIAYIIQQQTLACIMAYSISTAELKEI